MHVRNVFPIYKRLLIFCGFPSKPKTLISRTVTNSGPNPVDFDRPSPNLFGDLITQFSSMLQYFSDASGLEKGRQVHAQIIVHGFGNIGFLETRILGMYVLCRSIVDAKNMFFQVEKWQSLPWNWMIRGLTMMGFLEFALLIYFKMLGIGILPDSYTFPHVIKACCGLKAVKLGRMIHQRIHLMGLDMDVFAGSSLIKMYAENDAIDYARQVFDKMCERDCVLWNVMINGYVANGDATKALGLFCNMRNSETRPNYVTLASVLSICASEGKIEYGTQLHGLVIRCGLDLNVSVSNTLLAMYSKCRCLVDARKLFDSLDHKDVVSWNGIIAGCVQNRLNGEALDLFYAMQSAGVKPDSITFSSFLPSFSDSAGLKQGM